MLIRKASVEISIKLLVLAYATWFISKSSAADKEKIVNAKMVLRSLME